MGCGTSSSSSSSSHASSLTFSLSGHSVTEINNYFSRISLLDNESLPVQCVAPLILINALNKEVIQRVREQSIVPRNVTSEFIDVREIFPSAPNLEAKLKVQQSQMLLFFLRWEIDDSSQITDHMMKVLFDFKQIYILCDSFIPSSAAAADIANTTTITLTQSQPRTSKIPPKVLQLIQTFSQRGVKPASFNVVSADYSRIARDYPEYQVTTNLVSGGQLNTANSLNLVGENEVLKQTIFTAIVPPLFLYDHAVFHACNHGGIKVTSDESITSTIFTSTLSNYLEAVRTSQGRDYYNKSLAITTIILILMNDISDVNSAAKVSSITSENPSTPAKIASYYLTNRKESQLRLLKHLHKAVESGQKILVVREVQEGLSEFLVVFKALLFEKYQIFAPQIVNHLLAVLPKAIVFTKVVEPTNPQILVTVENEKKKLAAAVSEPVRLTRCEEMENLLLPVVKQYQKEREKSEEFISIIMTLIENIISHPNSEEQTKYRQIKRENKRLSETVFTFKQAPELLHLCGFLEDKSNHLFINQMSAGDLALIKRDLDIASKNAFKRVYIP